MTYEDSITRKFDEYEREIDKMATFISAVREEVENMRAMIEHGDYPELQPLERLLEVYDA